MGSIISSGIVNDDPYRKSNVKLQAQSVPPFNGDPHKWQTWKKKSRAAIGTAGLLRILDDSEYAKRHELENETIFHLLQVATTEGNASFLVDQFEDKRDGRMAYDALEKWFEGMKLQNETAEDIRSKLNKNILTTKITATKYINQFLSHTKQLKDLDKSYTTSKTVSMFLENIHNPDYQNTVELCLAHNYDIHECIMQVHAKGRRLEREEAAHRRARIQVRRFQNNSVERDHQESMKIEDIDISKHKTNLGYYSVPSEVWNSLSEENKTQIKQFNSNLRKKRKSLENQPKEQPTISTRRNIQASINDECGPPSKKQKTITFNDEGGKDDNEASKSRDEVQELNNRRGILKFNIKSSNKN